MFYVITIDQIIHWTQLLYLLLSAVWLSGRCPLSNAPSISNRDRPVFSRRFSLGSASICSLVRPQHPTGSISTMFPVTLPIALAGLGLAICGVAFSIWARLILGENWSSSPTIKQDHRLIVSGPYRAVRHPIYTGLLLALLGSALQHGLVRSFLAVLTCAVGLYLKVSVEEEFMIHRFGEAYLRYRRNVSALVPFLF